VGKLWIVPIKIALMVNSLLTGCNTSTALTPFHNQTSSSNIRAKKTSKLLLFTLFNPRIIIDNNKKKKFDTSQGTWKVII
jgi:hypothetical protein